MKPIELLVVAASLAIHAPAHAQTSNVEMEITTNGQDTFTFQSADGSATYGGTLTLPDGPGPHPAIVLLSVAGPNDRDQTVGPHKGFAELADELARNGVASLRFDDRGVGSSTGEYFSASWDDFAADAAAAYDALASDPRIAADRIGFGGMSQGGALAAMASKLQPGARLALLMSAPGLSGAEALTMQTEALISQSGLTPETADQYRAAFREYLSIVTLEDRSAAREQLAAFLSGPGRALIPPFAFLPQEAGPLADLLLDDWYRSNLTFDPRAAYSDLSVPVMVVGGGRDPVAPASHHMKGIADIIGGAGNRDLTSLYLETGNHLLQAAQTGMPGEYANLDHAIAPEIAAAIAAWVAENLSDAG